jgi:hypothetical protein
VVVPIVDSRFNEGGLIGGEIDGDFVADHAGLGLWGFGFIYCWSLRIFFFILCRYISWLLLGQCIVVFFKIN